MRKALPLKELVKTWEVSMLQHNLSTCEEYVKSLEAERDSLTEAQIIKGNRMDLNVSIYREELKRRNNGSSLTTYEQESLTALYVGLDFCKCNDLPCGDIEAAIEKIELMNS